MSGGIYRRRRDEALAEWESLGFKKQVENAEATISHILGQSMVQWKNRLKSDIENIKNTIAGQTGNSFFPATVIPGAFARSPGWLTLGERSIKRQYNSNSSTSSWSTRGSIGFGSLFGLSVGAAAGGSTHRADITSTGEDFGMSFKFTQAQIVRPWFNASFFMSRGWRPNENFKLNFNTMVHSDGNNPPAGACIGYATKAIFVKDLTIYSRDFAKEMQAMQSQVGVGGSITWGCFSAGGGYASSNESYSANVDINTGVVSIPGMQLIGFQSAYFPRCANPSPDVKESEWV